LLERENARSVSVALVTKFVSYEGVFCGIGTEYTPLSKLWKLITIKLINIVKWRKRVKQAITLVSFLIFSPFNKAYYFRGDRKIKEQQIICN
jgi:hypothetical protein